MSKEVADSAKLAAMQIRRTSASYVHVVIINPLVGTLKCKATDHYIR